MVKSSVVTINSVNPDSISLRISIPSPEILLNSIEILYGNRVLGSGFLPKTLDSICKISFNYKISKYSYYPILTQSQYRLTGPDGVALAHLNEASLTLLKAATTSPSWASDDFIIGQDGFLFLRAGNNRLMDVHTGALRLNPRQREQWVRNLRMRAEYSRVTGIPCITAVIPNKESVYHTLIPDAVKSPHRPLCEMPELAAIAEGEEYFHSMEDSLVEHSSNTNSYNKTNSYWTLEGAAVAFNGLLPILQRHGFSSIQPFDIASLDQRKINEVTEWGAVFSPAKFETGTVRYMAKRSSQIIYDNGISNRGHFRIHKNPDKSGSVLIFGDSFTFNVLWQFFAERFKFVCLARHPALDRDLVETLKPDLVLVIPIERFLINPPDDESHTPFRQIAESLGKGSGDDWKQVALALGG